jgi:hypothetical protein
LSNFLLSQEVAVGTNDPKETEDLTVEDEAVDTAEIEDESLDNLAGGAEYI